MDSKSTEKTLKLLFKATKENLIYEKTSIKHHKDGKRVVQSNIKKLNLQTKKIIARFQLETKQRQILLVTDYPINHYLSYNIIIHETEKIFQFKLKEPKEDELLNQTYISDETTKNHLENEIIQSTIKEISPEEIIGQKYKARFQYPKKIEEIREYINSKENLDTNIINSIPTDRFLGVQNLNPTLKNTHFKLAKIFELPITPQIKHEFIIDENINVFDINKIIEIINPTKIVTTKQLVPVDKNTLKRTYLDVSTTYHLKVDKKLLIEKIKNTQITSEPKEKIIKTIENLTQTEISQNYGETEIPLWKIHKHQNFIKIENFNHFKEITGINYPENQEDLEEIFILDNHGELGFLKHQFLKKRFKKTFETLPENEILVYRKPLDLAIKSLLCENIQLLIKYQKVSEKQIQKLILYTQNLIEIIIIETIKHNKIPKPKIPTKNTQTNQINQETPNETLTNVPFDNGLGISNSLRYYSSLNYKLKNEINKFLKTPKKTNLIHSSNNELKTLQKYLKATPKIEYNELYPLTQVILQNIQIIGIFDTEAKKQIEERFNQYFKSVKKDNNENNEKENSKEYRFIKQIFLANKLSKKSKTKDKILIIEKQPFDKTQLNNQIKITKQQPDFQIKIKPKYSVLRKIFPFKYKELAKQILKIKPGAQNVQLDLKISKIPLKKEYVEIRKIYKKYKIICDNNSFTILKLKNNTLNQKIQK